MIDHQKNGYLADPFNSDDLASGIHWVLENDNWNAVSQKAVGKVREEFDIRLTARNYLNMYERILQKPARLSVSKRTN